MENKKILVVDKLNKYFNKSGKLVKILDNITFDVYEKDFLGIIGESGSGKSTTGKCIIRLYSSSSGNILFDDVIINQKHISKKTKRWLYQNMSMIFQDPMSSLNPRKTILSIIAEPLIINKTIKKETLDILNNCKKINPFFKNTYKMQDYELTKQYIPNFYLTNINLFENLIQHIKVLNNDASNLDYLKNILLDMETKFKDSLAIYSEYIKLIKKLYKHNLNKYELNQLENSEIEYQQSLNNLLIKKNEKQSSTKYLTVKEFKDKMKNDLNTFLDENKLKFNEQNSNRIKAIKTKYNAEIKSLKQQRYLTTSINENIYDKVSVQILKDTLRAIKLIDRDIYVEQHEIEAFSNFINEKIHNKYLPLIDLIHKLGGLSEEIDKLLESNETSDENLREKLIQYNDMYYEVLKLLKQYKNQDPLVDNIEVKKAIEWLKNSSKQKYAKIKYEQTIQIEKINSLNKELLELKNDFIRNDNTLVNEAYQEAKKEFKIAKMARHEWDVQGNDYFKQHNKPEIKKLHEEINKYIHQLTSKQKEFKKLVKHKLKAIEHELKQKDLHKNNELKILINEIKNKLDTISAINFEIDTYNQDLNLYRRLRSTNLLMLILNNRFLQQSLTREYVYNALNEVGLKNEHAYRYPHEFSGGQRQRIVIARSLISKPKLVIADEPISALDVSIQAQVINIMKSLAEKYGITFLFIAHDLSMVRYTSNRLIILHKGRIVEKGNTQEIFNNPIHPYTKSLIKASPELSKIHINLASFSSKLDYDKDYSPNNIPEFFKVPNETEHYVFATKEQFDKWIK